MRIDTQRLVQAAAAAAVSLLVAWVWSTRAELASMEVRLTGAEDVLDTVIDTLDALHPRGTAAMGGGDSRAASMQERLRHIQQRVPEPGDDDDSAGDDDDSAAGAP